MNRINQIKESIVAQKEQAAKELYEAALKANTFSIQSLSNDIKIIDKLLKQFDANDQTTDKNHVAPHKKAIQRNNNEKKPESPVAGRKRAASERKLEDKGGKRPVLPTDEMQPHRRDTIRRRALGKGVGLGRHRGQKEYQAGRRPGIHSRCAHRKAEERKVCDSRRNQPQDEQLRRPGDCAQHRKDGQGEIR